MFLKRGIFINWGNIPVLETAFDFGPINLFSGGNGSGKTTAADAIQTLMTAAHENLFNFNPGQDETTQRGRGGKQVRTLASYVLGCDDGSYSRPQRTDAYVAGVFHPTQGEAGDTFTAVMCMRAHLDSAGAQKQARLDELVFLIIPGEQLSQSHFVKRYSDGRHVVPIDDVINLLKKEFGSKNIEVYDKKGAYLRRLYGALRGRRDAVSDREAKHAARTFSNFMAYKPVKSINEFVAREILEPKDLGDAIRNVSELMKTIHQMESDTKAIRNSIETLSQGKSFAEQYINQWTERQTLNYAETCRQQKVLQKQYVAIKSDQKNTQNKQSEIGQKAKICEQRRTQLHEEIVSLEAQRQGITALKDKDELEKRIKDGTNQLIEQTKPLVQQEQQFHLNTQAAKKLLSLLSHHSFGMDLPALDTKSFRQTLKTVADSDSSVNLDINKLLGKDWVDISPLESVLDQVLSSEQAHKKLVESLLLPSETAKNKKIENNFAALKSLSANTLRDQIALQCSTAERKIKELNSRLQQKEREIQLLQSKKVSYPSYVEQALAAIRKQCPKADPQVLCDFIEVTDPQWQMAIEGYIGGARFSIIVDPGYEAQAIRIVRNLPDARRNKARVIQGQKAQKDAERLSIQKDSILEVMSFTHKVAEFYLRASYGNVLRVEDAEALRHTARGITSEGLGSGNYSMWRCDLSDSELVFGQGARVRALHAKQAECEQLLVEAQTLETSARAINEVFDTVEIIKPLKCSDVIQQMLSLHRSIRSAESALERLDLSDYKELEQQLINARSNYATLESEHRQLGEEAGKLLEREAQINKKIHDIANRLDAQQQLVEDVESQIFKIPSIYPDFDSKAAIDFAENKAEQGLDQFNFEEEIRDTEKKLEELERNLYQVILTHNQQANSSDAIVYDTGFGERHDPTFFKRLVNLREEINLIHNRLKNNVLVDKFEKLSTLRDSFNTAFVTNLCHSIYQAINDGKRILDDLNAELESHKFGADKERFYFAYDWVPEYREYWRFFKEVIDLPSLGDGTNLFDAELSPKACEVRDKMLEMLLDPDEQIALRELNRLSDYRNYRFYEIFKEPEGKAPIALSQYGTGSGGQLETPAYIIRSAAVTSAFRFNEGSTHLRMVLVDEAFSKMDETRSREVINYLTHTLGLQLVFIMPTSKSGPFMDLISNQFVFSKCPTASKVGELNTRVLVDRKECNQEKIKQLWANHRKTIRHQAALDFMEGL